MKVWSIWPGYKYHSMPSIVYFVVLSGCQTAKEGSLLWGTVLVLLLKLKVWGLNRSKKWDFWLSAFTCCTVKSPVGVSPTSCNRNTRIIVAIQITFLGPLWRETWCLCIKFSSVYLYRIIRDEGEAVYDHSHDNVCSLLSLIDAATSRSVFA